jgi:hypothetical protein
MVCSASLSLVFLYEKSNDCIPCGNGLEHLAGRSQEAEEARNGRTILPELKIIAEPDQHLRAHKRPGNLDVLAVDDSGSYNLIESSGSGAKLERTVNKVVLPGLD